MKINLTKWIRATISLALLASIQATHEQVNAQSFSPTTPVSDAVLDSDGNSLNTIFTENQRAGLSKAFNFSKPDSPSVMDGLEAVYHAKGSKANELTLKNAARWLERPQGHGAFFEQLVAKDLVQQGARVDFVTAGNVGTDLREFPRNGQPMTFIQVKATANSVKSAQEALVDGLAFAGKQANRPKELLDGRIAFKGVIPTDQFTQLIENGQLLPDGSPSSTFIENIFQEASQRAKGNGEEAVRLRGALQDSPELLAKMTVKPGPMTYDELREATKNAALSIRSASRQVGSLASKPLSEIIQTASQNELNDLGMQKLKPIAEELRAAKVVRLPTPPTEIGQYAKAASKAGLNVTKTEVVGGLLLADGRVVMTAAKVGAGAGLLTFAVDGGVATMRHINGSLLDADYERELGYAAIKGTSVGAGVAVAVVLGATPAGWVVLAVGTGVYIVTDFAVRCYEDKSNFSKLTIDDLKAFGIPASTAPDLFR
jgi:hypothetical protein